MEAEDVVVVIRRGEVVPDPEKLGVTWSAGIQRRNQPEYGDDYTGNGETKVEALVDLIQSLYADLCELTEAQSRQRLPKTL